MIIFSDFDATIARNDVGDTFFQTFGNRQACEEAVQAWLRGEISSRQCLDREAATTSVSKDEVDSFCDQQKIDPNFPAFVEFCRRQDIKPVVLSDGMDYYIQRILVKHDLKLPVYSNHLVFVPPKSIKVEYPYLEFTCGRCANCKGYQVRRLSKPDERKIFIGDGMSDRCGVLECDVVFAKGELAQWCERQGIGFQSFTGFGEIQRIMSTWNS